MRFIGIDIGKVSLKAVILDAGKRIKEPFWKVHLGEIEKVWQELKEKWQIKNDDKVGVTGRFREMLPYPGIPEKVAQQKSANFLYPDQEATVIRLGGGGFSVLKTKKDGQNEYRQNPRCAAGTGTFLDQILGRLKLDITEVDKLVNGIQGAEITSRCGVTMKTDLTHLLNAGHPVSEVIAGLLDSSAKNAAALALKSPINGGVLWIIGGLAVCQRIVRTVIKELGYNKELSVNPFYFESLGAALIASEGKLPKIRKTTNFSPLVFLPALKDSFSQATKLESPEITESVLENLILGLDIGSTGSKAVLFGQAPIFEAYVDTKGDPVGAAKNLIQKIPFKFLDQVKGVGCTGSGREIVASLIRASLPQENHQQIFVLNEIAAHAAGAVFYDPRVDTIVDIGGQDAKFIKLEEGRVVDNAMNTVCSAGTGSFLAEQAKLLRIENVGKLGQIAIDSRKAVDLGQHCAIFISEQIDDAKRKEASLEEIVAGLYYSVAKNYNNRVKGQREYGQIIFLQGQPANNIALGYALARVSGKKIIIPPSPGFVGAVGISILAEKEIANLEKKPILNFEKFLKAGVIARKEFKCQSKDGCLEGNQCSINVIDVEIQEQKLKFFWGGRCDKYEKTGKNLQLAKAPQPFLERERLISELIMEKHPPSTKTIGIPRGLETEEILPLLITFFQQIGFKVKLLEGNGLKMVEQGSKLCQSDFCAPLQCLAGQAQELEKESFIFLPKVIEIEGQKQEKRCYVCPLSQAMPDMFGPKLSAKILNPFLNFRAGYEKNLKEFVLMGFKSGALPWESILAFKKAVNVQRKFEERLLKFGKETLEFGEKQNIPVVVVLGHPYIIHSKFLNAGVPEIVMEKGGLALPADCYPLTGEAPILNDIYWGYGHRLLDVTYEARRRPNIFPLWLSVYSCGPDSFLIHFFQHLSQGKPYTLLESDAYTGQAGFKTRIEAFIYSIKNFRPKDNEKLTDLVRFESSAQILKPTEKRKVLIPWMGEGSILATALIKSGLGINADFLPMADETSLELGRQVTSGKECLPMIITFGSLLKYTKERSDEKFIFYMPSANGPCRFGQYNILDQILLENLGLSEQIKLISPNSETGYGMGQEFNKSMRAKAWAAFVLTDLLKDALHEIRPAEKVSGQTEKTFNMCLKSAENWVLKAPNDWSGFSNLWGMEEVARNAVEKFKNIPQIKEKSPKVLVTGEIFVRHDAFSNNHIVKELEALGAKVKLAPFREWINYTLWQRRKKITVTKQIRWQVCLTWLIQKRIEARLYYIFAKGFDWKEDHSIDDILKAAVPYLSRLRPLGESALTVGLPLLLWQKKEIDGVVLVGPFECMPTRIGENQLELISEKTGLPVLPLSFRGDPTDKELLESFVWDLKNKSVH